MQIGRQDVVLIALASAGRGVTPVQIQKLCFILDREATKWLGGPHFAFYAHDYGPFDPGVYSTIGELATLGEANVAYSPRSNFRVYSLTSLGHQRSSEILGGLPIQFREYVRKLAAWVCDQSFASLVSSIYRRYPEMRERSIFSPQESEHPE